MTRTRFFRNLLFALILLLVMVTLDEANLPLTQRLEEYVAFVLTTDFDHGTLLARARSGWGWPAEWNWPRWREWFGERLTRLYGSAAQEGIEGAPAGSSPTAGQ